MALALANWLELKTKLRAPRDVKSNRNGIGLLLVHKFKSKPGKGQKKYKLKLTKQVTWFVRWSLRSLSNTSRIPLSY